MKREDLQVAARPQKMTWKFFKFTQSDCTYRSERNALGKKEKKRKKEGNNSLRNIISLIRQTRESVGKEDGVKQEHCNHRAGVLERMWLSVLPPIVETSPINVFSCKTAAS